MLFLVQVTLGLIVGAMLYYMIGLNNFNIPGIANFQVGIWFIPLAAMLPAQPVRGSPRGGRGGSTARG